LSGSFEKFPKSRISQVGEPLVTIRKSGVIGINSEAMERFFGEARYLEFYYDRKNKRIGLKPLRDRTKDSYTVFPSKRSKSANVFARKFLRFYGIDFSKTKSYVPYWDDEGKLLVVDLQKGEKEVFR